MGKNWAISIGINKYDNLQDLNFAKRDAEAMAAWFREEAKFDQVFLFTEDSPAINTSPAIPTQPTYGRLRRFLQAQFEQPLLEPGDNLWFFFAGHGMRHADKDYLMLADSDPGDIEHTAISVEFITERLRRSRADNVVLFLDACREESSRSGLGIGLEQHQGVITFYSCAANQKSWEITELQHGSFTYTLLTGLRLHGEANCATVERLDRYLNSSVPKLNTRYQKEIQNPYLKAEPPYKMYYILLEQSATMKDVESLKLQASLSENAGNFELAEQIWIRVLGVSRADLDAVSAIKRIAIKKNNSTLLPISQPVPNSESASSSRGDATMSPTEILELAEKIKENNRKQEEYRQALLKEVAQQFPLNQKSIDNLSNLQKSLQLSEEEVSGIKQPIFIQKEAEYRKREEEERIRKEQQAERIRQQHQQNLEQYQREFSAKIEREYPLHQANRNKFKRLQNSLQLSEQEILQIEQPIIAKKEAEYQKLQEGNRKTSGNSSGSNPPPIKRRQFLIYAGLGGTGLVTTVVFSQILKPKVQPKLLELLTFTFTTKTVNKTGKIVNLENHQAKYFKEDLGNGITLEMVQIPGGSFMMGSPESEKDRYNNESPQHQVNVPGFSMGKFVVTQEQYQQIMGKNPSYFTEKGAKRPVEKVSWNNAVEFCQKLSEKTGREYRLPSEAEWEYACRGGTTTPFYFGETITTDLANYNGTYTYASEPKGKSLGQTTEVGSFPPNSFGLYDIHGNVWEWCQEDWHDNYANAPKDVSAWTSQSGNSKRLRGGSWFSLPVHCRSASRYSDDAGFGFYYNGFRVVCGAAWTQ
ncbi:SUMF1/EgtB/PvdO family nonheme iron enzyme [Dolichospermum circinale]|uniref:SUMF1/EgtB/PvdO family nonheme iron enzyme n=1 Tax=Dolichospermum circinale TaxID=109265 RepID=UPI00232FBF76|nr:SUMF1/EgtB/PvdO family nonheme iron enzyme [Dolichospermum circinale]MDB9455653.1 SUMF1/EgtB/PvdO family nonheme iron enzyme [Dolichospermum circinale CS-541/06]MDB9461583.1 SUMF1/EgtB/PvdO family nonheme iron enzyme [Dolichospermum circinale CS-541/04]MDB9547741.1 SUMF1/EgtB/PvdO family nonheme iron enzyme [Dolichospermum circinale CS-1031]